MDTTEGRAYSLLPDDHPRLPLCKKHPIQACYLNEVFWLVYDNMSGAPIPWRSLSFYDLSRVEDIAGEALAESEFSKIAASPSGNGQSAVQKISKHFVAYLEGLVALPPYARGTADPRATGLAEAVAVSQTQFSTSATRQGKRTRWTS